jgi:integrase
VKQTKTRLSRRAVPLQAIALEALDHLPRREDSPLLFPNTRGGHLDFRNFNRRHWKPVQKSVGIEPLHDLYDLRHTYATFALRAGVPVFALSQFMGTSIAMIDLHYGHLAGDSYQHAVSLLDALALERAVDAGGHRRAGLQSRTATRIPGLAGGVRGGWWTLCGRRGLNPPLPDLTEAPD